MSLISLGLAPIEIDVVLAHGGDFVAHLVAEQPWPTGSAVQLRFSSTATSTAIVWTATIAGNRVTWDVPAAQVQMAIATKVARLHYIEPDGTVLVWGRGRVRTV